MCEFCELSFDNLHTLMLGFQVTCFIGTKVQRLIQKARLACPNFLSMVERACKLHVAKITAAAEDDKDLPLCDWLFVDWEEVGIYFSLAAS